MTRRMHRALYRACTVILAILCTLLVVVATASLAHAQWTDEHPDPCTGYALNGLNCVFDPDPLHCSWNYPAHPLCEGRPQFPRPCEVAQTCVEPGDPVVSNPCTTEPAWCRGPLYRPEAEPVPVNDVRMLAVISILLAVSAGITLAYGLTRRRTPRTSTPTRR